MDFRRAIDAHVQWKSKLLAYIAKPDGSLHAATVSLDDQCELGKWIHGEGQRFATKPEFQKLIADHARFHRAAGDVIRRADSGQSVSEEINLGAKSEYAAASGAVITALMHLEQQV